MGQVQQSEMQRRKELAELAVDMIHRTMVHHIFWFKEVEHQMGFEKALDIMETASRETQLSFRKVKQVWG